MVKAKLIDSPVRGVYRAVEPQPGLNLDDLEPDDEGAGEEEADADVPF